MSLALYGERLGNLGKDRGEWVVCAMRTVDGVKFASPGSKSRLLLDQRARRPAGTLQSRIARAICMLKRDTLRPWWYYTLPTAVSSGIGLASTARHRCSINEVIYDAQPGNAFIAGDRPRQTTCTRTTRT